jgi:hypothetical protein
MIRCLEPKSDADVRGFVPRGDDLNPVECRLRPVLLGGFECMPDRFSLLFLSSSGSCFAHEAGGEGFLHSCSLFHV